MEHRFKKILFYLPNLHHNGAEGVMVDVANYLFEHDYEITFALVKAEGVLLGELNSNISVIDLNLRSQWLAPLKLPFIIRKLKPDYVFSTMKESNFMAILCRILAVSESKNIIREANTVSQETSYEVRWYQRVQNKIIFNFYSYAYLIVVLSDSIKQDLIRHSPALANNRMKIINNCVSKSKLEYLKKDEIPSKEMALIKGRKLFLCVGRLAVQKNYEFLLKALRCYKNDDIDFVLFVLGVGPLCDDLNTLKDRLNLNENCYFLGYQSNPFKYMMIAEVFILPSLYEGMSNSLVQAIALNRKVLVSDAQSTSLELISKYENGYSYSHNSLIDFGSQLTKVVKAEIKESKYPDFDCLGEYAGIFR